MWDDLVTATEQRDARTGWQTVYTNLRSESHRAAMAESGRVLLCGQVDVDMSTRTKHVAEARFPLSDGQAASGYLRGLLGAHGTKAIERPARGRWRRSWANLDDVPPPVFYAGAGAAAHTGSFALIDLNRAYWRVLSAATLDMSVIRTERALRVGVGTLTVPRPFDVPKAVGNALCGMLVSRTMHELRHGEDCWTTPNPLTKAPNAMTWVRLVLTAAAWQMIRLFGASYVMIDSYAVRSELAQPAIEFLAREWGLGAKIEYEGPGVFYGPGRYEIAGHRSGRVDGARPPRFSPRIEHLVHLDEAMTWQVAEQKRFVGDVALARGRPEDLDWEAVR